MESYSTIRKGARIVLQVKLSVAEKQIADNYPLIDHKTVMETMRRKINNAKKQHSLYPSAMDEIFSYIDSRKYA